MKNKCFIALILVITTAFAAVPAFALDMGSVASSSVISKETNYYTVTVSCGDGGSVFPNGSNRLKEGSSRFFTITPDAGFVVADVKVNGMSVGAVSGYRISKISMDISLEVSFTMASADAPVESEASSAAPEEPAGEGEPKTGTSDEDDNDRNPKNGAC